MRCAGAAGDGVSMSSATAHSTPARCARWRAWTATCCCTRWRCGASTSVSSARARSDRAERVSAWARSRGARSRRRFRCPARWWPRSWRGRDGSSSTPIRRAATSRRATPTARATCASSASACPSPRPWRPHRATRWSQASATSAPRSSSSRRSRRSRPRCPRPACGSSARSSPPVRWSRCSSGWPPQASPTGSPRPAGSTPSATASGSPRPRGRDPAAASASTARCCSAALGDLMCAGVPVVTHAGAHADGIPEDARRALPAAGAGAAELASATRGAAGGPGAPAPHDARRLRSRYAAAHGFERAAREVLEALED